MSKSVLAMLGSHVQSGIQGEDHHLFRVYKAYTSEARLVLLQVLTWGCPKLPSQTFEQYLMASGLSHTSYRKSFDNQQRGKISTNPSGDRFDISLLHKMIQMACHSLAPPEDEVWITSDDTRLEYLLTSIKNGRNNLVHNVSATTQDKMVEEIETLRDLLTKAIRISGILYCVNSGMVDQLLRRIHNNLNNIRDQPFAPLDLQDYGNHLMFDSLRATLCLNGAQELKQTYGSKIFLNPLSFLDKKECHLQVGAVFTSLSIQDLRACPRSRLVHCKKLLEHMETATPDIGSSHAVQNPSLMVLEGQPGSGKTTLLRLYMSQWIHGGEDIKGLSDYDLVLHFECRETCIGSFTQLLLSHMPQTTSKLRSNDLLHIFQSLKAMVLVDGLDELNLASQKVLREILLLKSSCDLTLICTSRAEKIRELLKLASGRVNVIHMKILGIPIEKREEFVRAYQCQLKQRGVSQLDISGLLDYLREVPAHLQDYFRFPLNLVLLAFLWDGAHLRVKKISSMTTLYLETHKLMIEKLLDRLTYHPSTQHLSLAKLTIKCESFRSVMYEEALRALAAGVVYLDERARKRLRDLCVSLDLPKEEVFSAFLVSSPYDNTLALSDKVKFPHKGIQDFYAARHITFLLEEAPFPNVSLFISKLDELLKESSVPTFAWRQIVKYTRGLLDQPVSIRSVLLEFHEAQSDGENIGRFQNVICHLVNLLHTSDPRNLEYYAAEMVTLLDAAKGMSFEHWIDVLKESHYNPTLAEEISKVLPKFSWTVKDQDVRAAAAFLLHNCPLQLSIDIMSDPNQLPHLHDLLQTASTCTCCKIDLYLHHHWRRPEEGVSNSFLLKLLPAPDNDVNPVSPSSLDSLDGHSSEYLKFTTDAVTKESKICLVEIMGRFSGQAVHSLPTSIKELHLALADDHDALDWFEALPKLSHTLPSLKNIWIHITGSISPDLLPILPQLLYRPRLYLSGVGDDNISWASRVARALLHPNSKYASVVLVRSSLSSRGVSQLAELLFHLGVGVYAGRGGGLLIASTHLSKSEVESVSESVLRYLNCSLALLNDDEIWNDESIYEEVYECQLYENMRAETPQDAFSIASHKAESESIYEYIEGNQEEVVNTNHVKKDYASYLENSAENEKHLESATLSSIYEDIEYVTGTRAPLRLPPSVLRSKSSTHTEFPSRPPRSPLPLPRPENSSGEYVNLSNYASESRPPPLPPRCKTPIYRSLSASFAPTSPPIKLHPDPLAKPLGSLIESVPKCQSSTTTESSTRITSFLASQHGLVTQSPKPDSSSTKHFFPPYQVKSSYYRPSRTSLPCLYQFSGSHSSLDQCSPSKAGIPQPLGLTQPHPQQRPYISRPVLPCPLTPKLPFLQPDNPYKRLCDFD